MRQVVIIGAGVGGLAASIRLAQRGCKVQVIEARDRAGGLAASLELDGFRFDAGPYILLDRLGLEWAFQQLGIDVEALLLQRITHIYDLTIAARTFRMLASVEETAKGVDRMWPGSGAAYRRFIAQMQSRYERLQPLQCTAQPRLGSLIMRGAWRDIPFLRQTLDCVMQRSGLPAPLVAALGIWTHVAGQTWTDAPSPLALVPAVIHGVGAYYPRGGIGAIPDVLYAAARRLDVQFRFGTKVRTIRCTPRHARGAELESGEVIEADAIVSNTGPGTYMQLLDDVGQRAIPWRTQRRYADLPLQSPGVCAYLAVKGRPGPPYLRFRLGDEPDGCRLLITPSVLDASLARDGWSPARLIAPLNHQRAEMGGEAEQQAFLRRVLEEPWWRDLFEDVRILATRVPRQWGESYNLFRDSMNPVMTAAFMRAGRLAHRSPWIRQLYLTGSATHPGQWVSFCAVSGVLAADQALEDFAG